MQKIKKSNNDNFSFKINFVKLSKKILIFSEDTDFCKNVSLLFQNNYNVLCSNFVEEIKNIVDNEEVDLLLADSAISDSKIYQALKNLKLNNSKIIIILLYVYKFSNIEFEQEIRKYIDALFYKPVDIIQVMKVVNDLLMMKNTI